MSNNETKKQKNKKQNENGKDLISIDPETGMHTLNISFGIPFREPTTDELITRVALPEGASDIEV